MDKLTFQQQLAKMPGVKMVEGQQEINFNVGHSFDRHGFPAIVPATRADYTFKATYKCQPKDSPAFEEFLRDYMDKGVVQSIGITRFPHIVYFVVKGYAGTVRLDNERTGQPDEEQEIKMLSGDGEIVSVRMP